MFSNDVSLNVDGGKKALTEWLLWIRSEMIAGVFIGFVDVSFLDVILNFDHFRANLLNLEVVVLISSIESNLLSCL